MFIIWGTSGTELKAKQTNIQSPKDADGKIMIMGEKRYFHIFWIPFFSTSTKWTLFCNKTHKIINEKNLKNPNHLAEIKEVKKSYGKKWWMFIGLILFVILFALPVLTSVLFSRNITKRVTNQENIKNINANTDQTKKNFHILIKSEMKKQKSELENYELVDKIIQIPNLPDKDLSKIKIITLAGEYLSEQNEQKKFIAKIKVIKGINQRIIAEYENGELIFTSMVEGDEKQE